MPLQFSHTSIYAIFLSKRKTIQKILVFGHLFQYLPYYPYGQIWATLLGLMNCKLKEINFGRRVELPIKV
jgi:hypothetical protein